MFKEISSIYLRAFSHLDHMAPNCLKDTMNFIYKTLSIVPFVYSFVQLSFPVMPTTELFKDFCPISLRAHLSKFHFSNVFITFVEFHMTLPIYPF